MTPSPTNSPMPTTTATVPATPAEVLAVLQRMHDRLDQLIHLINRPYQP